MAWFVLVAAGALEAVWAVALGKSEGFTRLAPSVVFLISLAASMAGLGYAMRTAHRHRLRRMGRHRSGVDRRVRHGHWRRIRQPRQGATHRLRHRTQAVPVTGTNRHDTTARSRGLTKEVTSVRSRDECVPVADPHSGSWALGTRPHGSSYGTRTVEHSSRHFTRRVAPQSCASMISARLRADPSDRARISDLSANSARRQERANSTARFALSAIAA